MCINAQKAIKQYIYSIASLYHSFANILQLQTKIFTIIQLFAVIIILTIIRAEFVNISS